MKQEIETNYRQVKIDIVQVLETELERIKNDPDLQHLIKDTLTHDSLFSMVYISLELSAKDLKKLRHNSFFKKPKNVFLIFIYLQYELLRKYSNDGETLD